MIPVLNEPAELREGIAANEAASVATASDANTVKCRFGCLTFVPSVHFQSFPLLSANYGLAFSHACQKSCGIRAQTIGET